MVKVIVICLKNEGVTYDATASCHDASMKRFKEAIKHFLSVRKLSTSAISPSGTLFEYLYKNVWIHSVKYL